MTEQAAIAFLQANEATVSVHNDARARFVSLQESIDQVIRED